VEGHRPSTAETAANIFKARELTAAEDLVETTSSASINGEAKEGSEGPVAAPAARRHGKGDVQAAATAGGGTGGSFRHRQGGSGLRGGHGVVCRVGERS
jgi:hypothetical protein